MLFRPHCTRAASIHRLACVAKRHWAAYQPIAAHPLPKETCAMSANTPRLLDRVRALLRRKHYSLRTEEAYVGDHHKAGAGEKAPCVARRETVVEHPFPIS